MQAQSDVHVKASSIVGNTSSERATSIRQHGATLSRECALVHALASIVEGGYISKSQENIRNIGGDIIVHKKWCPNMPIYCDPVTTVDALQNLDIIRGNAMCEVSHVVLSGMSINSNHADTGMLRLSKLSIEGIRATNEFKAIQKTYKDYKELKRKESIVSVVYCLSIFMYCCVQSFIFWVYFSNFSTCKQFSSVNFGTLNLDLNTLV